MDAFSLYDFKVPEGKVYTNPYTGSKNYKIIGGEKSPHSIDNLCLSLHDAVKQALVNPNYRIVHVFSKRELPRFATRLNANPFFVSILKSENPLGELYKNLDFILGILDRETFLNFFREKNIEINYYFETSMPTIWARPIIDSYIGYTPPNYFKLIELLNFLYEKTKDIECNLWFNPTEYPFNVLFGSDGIITIDKWNNFKTAFYKLSQHDLGSYDIETGDISKIPFDLYIKILEAASYVYVQMNKNPDWYLPF